MGKRPDRNAERPGQSKVGELQRIGAPIYQQVLGLQIPVKHAVRVAVRDAPQDLVEEGLQAERETALHFDMIAAKWSSGQIVPLSRDPNGATTVSKH